MRDLPKVLVHERHELVERVAVAVTPHVQEPGDVSRVRGSGGHRHPGRDKS